MAKQIIKQDGKTYIFEPGENGSLTVPGAPMNPYKWTNTTLSKSKIIPGKYADPEIERRRQGIAKSILPKSKVIPFKSKMGEKER